MSTYIEHVEINEHFLEKILEVLGYPIVDKEIIYDIYSKEYIIDSVISEALELFYNYFPIVKEYEFFSTKTETSIESPFENVLGIIQYSKPEMGTSSPNLNSGNPFYTATQVSYSGSTYQSWGTPYKYYGSSYNVFQNKFYQDSLKNMSGGTIYYLKYDEANNKFVTKSAIGGVIHALIGCYSSNVDDIAKNKRPHFLSLCQAMLGLKFSAIVGLQNDDLPLNINWEDLKESSQEKYDNELEWLQNNSTMPLMR